MAEQGSLSGWAPLGIFLGAGLGALLRWGLSQWLNSPMPGLPWGTLAANLLGGLLIGLALHILSPQVLPSWDARHLQLMRLLLVTGFLGGLTTFSTYSAEVVSLIEQQRWLTALGWAAVHLVGSLALTGLGWAAARLLVTATPT